MEITSSDLQCILGKLLNQQASLAAAFEVLANPKGPQRCLPVVLNGKTRLLVSADELAAYVPRSPETLIDWARAGKIRGKKMPPLKSGGKDQWMFDLFEVVEDVDGFTTGR
jgi:hypothetical protein